ncbi:DUF6418 domain-containing protein [Bradyrhizobium sp.]|uniref:DUF6418 domain-containing protein n=1 Tax=Bradyrhizobium sp. TaxID=376 RepID=UPI0025BA391A|nr:DUF6418 domain-containing protein [Bradyrhizobium sp.]
MATFPEQMAVAVSGAALLLCVLYIAAYRPVIFLAFFFILFTLVWRTASTAFIDLAGPVLSSQTDRYIGPGLATPLHVLAYFVTLMPFFVLLRPAAVQYWLAGADRTRAAPGMLTLSDVTIVLSLLFLGLLFVDLLRSGSIPLFAEIERFVYTAEIAGGAHRWLILYGNLLAFWWGVMFAAESLRNRRIDIRYIGMLVVLMAYMFLTGNRFSAFYSFGSFFVIPLAAVVAAEIGNRHSSVPFFWIGRTLRRRDLIAFGAILTLVTVVSAVAIYNNLSNVRQFEGAEILSQFWERLLVQPSELGWISYQRIFGGQWQPDRVYDFLFQAPLDASRNTTPQFLMLATIGEPRTYEHISGGFQFAGGFPEIFFELFGPILAWPFIFGAGYLAAGLTAVVVKGVIQGRYASAFLSLYVLFGFYVMYIGGMLNFIMTPVYWIKIAALAAALLMEARLARAGLPLAPWALFRIPGKASIVSGRFPGA